jgi:hypothetical protein
VSAQHVAIGVGTLGETAGVVGAGWTFLHRSVQPRRGASGTWK